MPKKFMQFLLLATKYLYENGEESVELGPAPGCVKCLSEFIFDIHMTHGCNVNKFSRMHFRGVGMRRTLTSFPQERHFH